MSNTDEFNDGTNWYNDDIDVFDDGRMTETNTFNHRRTKKRDASYDGTDGRIIETDVSIEIILQQYGSRPDQLVPRPKNQPFT